MFRKRQRLKPTFKYRDTTDTSHLEINSYSQLPLHGLRTRRNVYKPTGDCWSALIIRICSKVMLIKTKKLKRFRTPIPGASPEKCWGLDFGGGLRLTLDVFLCICSI